MALIEIKRKKSLVPMVVCLVLTVVLGVVWIFPKLGAVSTGSATLTIAQNDLKDLQAKQAKMNASLKQLNNNSDVFSNLNLAIPNKSDVPDIYAHLEQMASSVNLKITTLQAIDQNKNSAAPNAPIPGSTAANIAAPVTPASAPAAPSTSPAGTAAPAGAAVPSPTLGTIGVNMEVVGNVDDVNSFLMSIEKSLRIIDVQSIDVTAKGEGAASITAFRISMTTYYQNSSK